MRRADSARVGRVGRLGASARRHVEASARRRLARVGAAASATTTFRRGSNASSKVPALRRLDEADVSCRRFMCHSSVATVQIVRHRRRPTSSSHLRALPGPLIRSWDGPPDASFDADAAAGFVGESILAGITEETADGRVLARQEYHGVRDRDGGGPGRRAPRRERRADLAHAAVAARVASCGPRPRPPAPYRLRSTGEEVEDPDHVLAMAVRRAGARWTRRPRRSQRPRGGSARRPADVAAACGVSIDRIPGRNACQASSFRRRPPTSSTGASPSSPTGAARRWRACER